MKRLAVNYVTTAANATEQQFTLTTNDDYRVRHIKSVFLGIATSGVQLTIYTLGQLYTSVDATRFAAGDAILQVEFDAPAKQQLVIGLKNLAGAALTNVPIVFGYEVDSGTGP